LPAPERILTLLRHAITLVRSTPGRKGRIIDLQDCTELLVAGDLHGHTANLQVMLNAADMAKNPNRHLVLQELIHGKFRYPKGGDKSHQLIDLFAALKSQFPKQVHFIPGNHEMAQWTNRPVLKGDENLNVLFQSGVSEAYGPVYGPQVYDTYLDLFRALPVVLRTANRVLVCHSLPTSRVISFFDPTRLNAEVYDPADLQPGGVIHSILWGRDTTASNVEEYLRKMNADLLVSGHIASDQGYLIPNDHQIILDSAECPGGYLLFPTTLPLTQKELVGYIRVI